jgi:hypothetical protein
VKTGIGRFFNDLGKAPYKAIFNASSSGARTFNAILVQREIDQWIDAKKTNLEKRSGYPWGVLIHGNRVLSAGIFKEIGSKALEKPIDEFRKTLPDLGVAEIGDRVHASMVEVLEANFPGKFLAVLFKSPVSSKEVFDAALKKSPNSI